MELTTIKEPNAEALLDKKIEKLLNAYVTKAINEYRTVPLSSNGINTNGDIEMEESTLVAPSLSNDEKDKRIQELEKELEEVQAANAELYGMCRDMIVEDA
uniref:Uncharacterized protein n=1 Tax=Panagrolaimus davidi TaxID=227884 RepID=A0A914QHE1_9BILA